MQQQFIDGVELHRFFASGYQGIKNNVDAINKLNVFPVPDGDTGTNMIQTLGGGMQATSSNMAHVGKYMEYLSQAVLLSARGNSGVIFSQFIYGLSRGFAGKEKIEFSDFTYAFSCASEEAYRAILTPTEGTILTVIREAANFLNAHEKEYEDFETGFAALIEQMKESLANTPNLLPVLKEAGVVDSGGAGLLCFIEGIYAYICGEAVNEAIDFSGILETSASVNHNFGPDSVLEYGYCTEFILQLMNYKQDVAGFCLEEFTKVLETMGDSIVSVHNGSIVKIHIHTHTPEKALEHARKYGEFVSVKIENMSIQHSETQETVQKKKVKYAIVAVASGKGIVDYFYDIGADAVIDGGQTNNPSVNQFLEVFDTFDAEHIVVLPNNSNIIFTANQAAEMYTTANVAVIPTKSVVEGYSALSMMNPSFDTIEEFVENMTAPLANAITAYVTPAIRDAVLDGIQVQKDEFMGLNDKSLITTGTNRVETAAELIRQIMTTESKEVIIVFYGQEVAESEAQELEGILREEYPLADIGFINGEQAIYDFIISLE